MYMYENYIIIKLYLLLNNIDQTCIENMYL